ncbi:Bacteriophage holin family [uncultured Caudovirales phage]|uniref:Bacteriophage holin family n=1 Tax=uncultured Caudovirales phage TaxID=2100421 RepID=A0A6J5N8H5_9CAUD|nr:Bacteriophage holin family [uncultured Caudovirales phage]
MKQQFIIFSKYFFVALVGFFAPILYAFILTIILVSADTITGVMKAGKDSIKDISSKKMFAVVPKISFYFLLIISAHSVQIYVEPQVPFTKLVLIGISWIEIKSIDENFSAIFGFSFMDKILEGMKSINQIKRHKDE